MNQTFHVSDITVGYHPAGFRIDKTASAMRRYTAWTIECNNRWMNPKPVCFDSLPQQGWFKQAAFNWDDQELPQELQL